jgi:hypothetical protein
MAIGDDALAAGMRLVLGTEMANTLETIINETKDEVAQRTWNVLPIDHGGTGATDRETAIRNLYGIQNYGSEWTRLGWNGSRLVWDVPGYVFPTELANYSDVTLLATELRDLVDELRDTVQLLTARVAALEERTPDDE